MLEAETPLKASSREVGTQREATPMESSTGYCRSSLPGFEAPGATSAPRQESSWSRGDGRIFRVVIDAFFRAVMAAFFHVVMAAFFAW